MEAKEAGLLGWAGCGLATIFANLDRHDIPSIPSIPSVHSYLNDTSHNKQTSRVDREALST